MSNDNKNQTEDLKNELLKHAINPLDIPKRESFQPNLFQTKIQPLKYENTWFKQMANDIKSPLEQQLESVESISDSAKKQADSAEKQAVSVSEHVRIMKEQLDLEKAKSEKATKTSLTAKFRANTSVAISGIALLATLLANADKIVHNVVKILSHLGLL